MNILYFHAGSGNHGCEALVRTIINICQLENVRVYSHNPDGDYKFGIDKLAEIIYTGLDTKDIIDEEFEEGTVAFSIGGDNYSTIEVAGMLAKYNKAFKEKGVKTALIGCSIEPKLFEYESVIEDLRNYDLITARETITYNNLLKKGIEAHLIPDSAFVLDDEEMSFDFKNAVGINLSGLVQKSEKKNKITIRNYEKLIEYLKTTNYEIVLIPHVVQPFNDDMEVLRYLANKYNVRLIEECSASEIKNIISKCELFVGTRTHASIAAYSSFVPTLVLGYSVKSKGIARDIFGTEKSYVLDVRNLTNENQLLNNFKWLETNKENIKKHLEEFMPDYMKRCYDLIPLVDDLK
jgi:colanic acid/amylovoran biosynthesis protein